MNQHRWGWRTCAASSGTGVLAPRFLLSRPPPVVIYCNDEGRLAPIRAANDDSRSAGHQLGQPPVQARAHYRGVEGASGSLRRLARCCLLFRYCTALSMCIDTRPAADCISARGASNFPHQSSPCSSATTASRRVARDVTGRRDSFLRGSAATLLHGLRHARDLLGFFAYRIRASVVPLVFGLGADTN